VSEVDRNKYVISTLNNFDSHKRYTFLQFIALNWSH